MAGRGRAPLLTGRWAAASPRTRRLHPTAAQRSDALAAFDLDNLSDGFLPLPDGGAAQSARLRSALHDWGVTTVVIPSEAGWPPALRGRSVPVAVAYVTTALGAGPVVRAGSWVWAVAAHPGAALAPEPAAFAACTTSPAAVRDPGAAAACVLATSPRRP